MRIVTPYLGIWPQHFSRFIIYVMGIFSRNCRRLLKNWNGEKHLLNPLKCCQICKYYVAQSNIHLFKAYFMTFWKFCTSSSP